MPLSYPGFPRRGIPTHKVRLPPAPERAKPFHKTALGRRLLIYGILFLLFLPVFINKARGDGAARQGGGDSRPQVALTNAPRQFVPNNVMHSLVSLEDFTEGANDGAIGVVLGYLKSLGGAESRASVDWTDLDVTQALAYPEHFRGGLVRIRGAFFRSDGQDIQQPAVPLGVVFRGWLAVREGHTDYVLAYMTDDRTKFEPPQVVEAEGVFLQAIRYEDKKGFVRTAPLVVVPSLRLSPTLPPQTFLDKHFSTAIIVLIIVVLGTTWFLLRRKSGQLASRRRFVARPPGPER